MRVGAEKDGTFFGLFLFKIVLPSALSNVTCSSFESEVSMYSLYSSAPNPNLTAPFIHVY